MSSIVLRLRSLRSLVVVATLLLTVATFGGAMTVSAHPQASSASSALNAATCTQRKDIVPLSTAQGKADVLRIFGQQKGAGIVAHMLHRYYSPDDCAGARHPASTLGAAAPGSLSAQAPHSLSCCDIQDIHWGGYYVDETNQGTNTNAVSTDFKAALITSTYQMYQWDGIGGVNGNKDLLQTGIGMSKHQAFYCEYDAPYNKCDNTGTISPTYLFNVNQGDSIHAYVARTGVGVWEVDVQDNTTGYYYQNTYAFSPDHTTAEWITEFAPSNLTIPSFPAHTYTGADWWDSNGNPIGYVHTLASAPHPVSVENFVSNGNCAAPGSVYSGDNFPYAHC